jgi:hypothetical protein
MKASTITRRQHFVWKHYLRAWKQQCRVRGAEGWKALRDKP